jgi:FlaA1/EpsC-like NDP-sugar epimerase
LLRRAARQIVALGRYPKRAVLVCSDLALLSFSLWLSFCIRYGEFFVPKDWPLAAMMALAPLLGVITFFQLDLYRLVTRYIGVRTLNRVALAVCLSILIWALIVWLSGIKGVPRGALPFYALLATFGIWGSRQLAGWALNSLGVAMAHPLAGPRDRVLIYGAGPTGIELAIALARSRRYDPVAFIDQNAGLWGQFVHGFKVYRPDRLDSLISRNGIKEVMLAMPEASRHDRAIILRSLEKVPVTVRTLPAIEDLASGRVSVNDLRPVEAQDLLGRDVVPPIQDLLHRNIDGKSVMVSGAGGTIGAELVRQIIKQRPKTLVLFEASEGALYEIESEVRATLEKSRAREDARGDEVAVSLHAVLGNVLNDGGVRQVIKRYGIETIYHAAAHKHVPIVENNPAAGVLNNTFGTIVLARAAQALDVERFVFVSTDKAVRPSSVMGASKRLAEMFLQSMTALGAGKTIFTTVRFGNVLDSSGSVVRLFRKQIEAGGPVTVTHPDMIRYFMSIPEAASLVIQAGAMAGGGEVFVLNMGEPVRIDELARSMIRLMGLTVREAATPAGDIAIEYIGLRPGEKLREELHLGGQLEGTQHPRIMSCREPMLPAARLDSELRDLREAIDRHDATAIKVVLARVVESYSREGRSEDKVVSDLHGVEPPSRAIH